MSPEHRRWMYNRTFPNGKGLKEKFVLGVDEFIDHAKTLSPYVEDGVIRCPCVECEGGHVMKPRDVKGHLLKKGFMINYYVWRFHEENDDDLQSATSGEGSPSLENVDLARSSELMDRPMGTIGMHKGDQSQPNVQHPINEKRQQFYATVEYSTRPLCQGSMHSKMSVAARLIRAELDWGISQAGINSVIGLMKEIHPSMNLPKDYLEAKILVSFRFQAQGAQVKAAGSSVSKGTHQRRSEKDKGKTVAYDEVIYKKHVKRKKNGQGNWVEPLAKRTHVDDQNSPVEGSQSQSSTS